MSFKFEERKQVARNSEPPRSLRGSNMTLSSLRSTILESDIEFDLIEPQPSVEDAYKKCEKHKNSHCNVYFYKLKEEVCPECMRGFLKDGHAHVDDFKERQECI